MKLICFLIVGLLSNQAFGFFPETTVKATRAVKGADIIFLKGLFEKTKLTPSMECEIKTRSSQAVRKFKDRTEWTETLEIFYQPYRYSESKKEDIVISTRAKYGSRQSSSKAHGPIEEFRIELGDAYDTFIEFAHDGRGNITNFIFGDIHRLYPCQLRRTY